MRKGDTILRVLEVSDEQALVINCQKRTMPVWMTAALQGYTEISEEELYEAMGEFPKDVEELDPEQRRTAYQRYTMIAGVLPQVADERERTLAIQKAAALYGKCEQTIRATLCKYLSFQSIGALIPKKRKNSRDADAGSKEYALGVEPILLLSQEAFALNCIHPDA